MTVQSASVLYEWEVADEFPVHGYESNGRRLSIVPRKLKVHVSSWHDGLWALIEGRCIRQSDGELGGVRSLSFDDEPREGQPSTSDAPAWAVDLIELARKWEAARHA